MFCWLKVKKKKKNLKRSRGVELVVGQTTVADKDHKGGTLCLDTWVGPSSIRGKGLACLLACLIPCLPSFTYFSIGTRVGKSFLLKIERETWRVR